MSTEASPAGFSGFSRLLVALSVVIGFTILVAGGAAFLLGWTFLGEALVLAGVFLFAFTLLCWLASRRQRKG
jgi:hypothetical protein